MAALIRTCLSLSLAAVVCLGGAAMASESAAATQPLSLEGMSEAIENLAQRVSPAVVQVITTG